VHAPRFSQKILFHVKLAYFCSALTGVGSVWYNRIMDILKANAGYLGWAVSVVAVAVVAIGWGLLRGLRGKSL